MSFAFARYIHSFPEICSQFAVQAIRAAALNQPLVSTILPSTEPDARSSIACLASRSGNVRVTRGSIFFSARSAKILGRSSRSGLGSFRYSIVMP